MILGDSLLVMTSLAEKERLKGRVQCIYYDPPYGIKFGSNWQVSTRKRDVKDAKAEDVTRQPEQIQAFRDTWQQGIHSYLGNMRDRLVAARDLLTDSGSIFVQIGDENVHLVRCLMDEVFGSENFISCINFQTMTPLESGQIENVFDYIIWYSKNKPQLKYKNLYRPKEFAGNAELKFCDLGDGKYRELTEDELSNLDAFPQRDRLFKRSVLESSGFTASCTFPFEFQGKTFIPRGGKSWRTNLAGMEQLKKLGRLFVLGTKLYFKLFHEDFPFISMLNSWSDTVAGFGETKSYVVQTHPKIIQRCLLMTSDPGDIVLDPTCGSGTTAYVAEQWGRRWITIDTSRVALALARTRLMASRYPFYLLTDSPAGHQKEAGLTATSTADTPGSPGSPDIRRGFVYKRVPHVTLKSIANNPDIKPGMKREQIDAAIRKHADTETLYDQPYEDKNTVRVTGPFTVESLSPHRMLPTGEPLAASEIPREAASGSGADYLTTILDNLRKAGVKTTDKRERLMFERLDVFPGQYIHAEGTYAEGDESKTVRVSIAPEFGTVDADWVRDAALESIKGSSCDLLLVCAFAFDPHVYQMTEELKKGPRFGRLRILPVRMNPDLAMGDELLKKTGAGNLFMVFGEPDIDVRKVKGGKIEVEIRGVDVYDPTTGELRSHGTDDIACWFIDTNYDGASFFVRHAYFCGGDEPYEKLKRALRASIDETEWAKLYSTTSVPFDAPKKGKIAVKVINHFGDEVLKVYPVGK